MIAAKNEIFIGLYHQTYYLVRGDEPLVEGIKIWWGESGPNLEYYGSIRY